MLKVGVTGNMGSGKSMVCRILGYLGVHVFYADDEAKRLMREDLRLRSAIQGLLGEEAYQPDGNLDRAYIAHRVFRDERLLEDLNALVHPRVRESLSDWFEALQPQPPYAVEEAALLFESGGYQQLDWIIMVSAPESLRVERVMQRDGCSRQEALQRMARQWPEDKKIILADDVIYNDGSLLVLPQVIKIHHKLSSGLIW